MHPGAEKKNYKHVKGEVLAGEKVGDKEGGVRGGIGVK